MMVVYIQGYIIYMCVSILNFQGYTDEGRNVTRYMSNFRFFVETLRKNSLKFKG